MELRRRHIGFWSLVSHTYAGYGSRIATLTVADNVGAIGEQSQAVMLTNTPPMATAEANHDPDADSNGTTLKVVK
jgi:hypothetical protein